MTNQDRSDAALLDGFRRAEWLFAGGDPAAALAYLAPLLEEDPDRRSVLELAARAWFATAQLSRAEAAFGRLVELDPSDAFARFGLGRTLERQSRLAQAAGHYRVAVALHPRPDYCAALERVSGNR